MRQSECVTSREEEAPFSLEQTITEGVALTARMLKVERCTVARLIEGGEALLLSAGIGWQAGVVGRAYLAHSSYRSGCRALRTAFWACFRPFAACSAPWTWKWDRGR